MKDADDPIPVGMISLSDAFLLVYRIVVSDWGTIEERLNPSAPFYEQLSEQDAERACREAWRSYDRALRQANEWLRTKISDSGLTALVRDPQTGDLLQLDRSKWPPLGGFETGIAGNHVGPEDPLGSGPDTVIAGERRPVFFSKKNFDAVLKNAAPLENGGSAHAVESVPAARVKLTQDQQIKETYLRLWPHGCSERPAQRNEKIRSDFRQRGRPAPADRSIQRALKSD
ncbi:hypothetical protein JQ595_32585 [Bradyrhizobium japonicum]|uniref:hypothetical protein n=1 Tax=Bradyrhizobium japonicum TaxID=375 RepID=UPI001BA587AE|nr:hypothetical protein [Bradyrhizobium japonicum]MBR0733493.1 hypothetical protein [Bradyrhizobium japonicum]